MESGRFTHHECCDCGLVHRVDYKLSDDGKLMERWYRDAGETRKARKKRAKIR